MQCTKAGGVVAKSVGRRPGGDDDRNKTIDDILAADFVTRKGLILAGLVAIPVSGTGDRGRFRV